MAILVEKLLKCYDYFLRLLEFPDLSGKKCLITFKCSQLDYAAMFCNSDVNKTVLTFLVLLRYSEIVTVKSLKSKKKKLALTLFCYNSPDIWLGNSSKLVCIDQSRFYIF